jgi:hypothetical protein
VADRVEPLTVSEERKCPERVASEGGWHFHTCGRKAVTERGFCRIHDPELREERRKKRGPTAFEREMSRIDAGRNELDAARSRIAALDESLAATKEALREAIADARRNAEERDAGVEIDRRLIAERDALRVEVQAWRIVDRLATGTDAYRSAYTEARRLRAQNEGGERG